MSRPKFGTLFPKTTLLATIGLAYSIVTPVMTALALLAFSVYWLAYKYLFLFTFDIPAAHETGGRFFPLAMNHIFIGLYASHIRLTLDFFLDGYIIEGFCMIILIVATIFSHLLIRDSFASLTMFVPLSMIDDGSISVTSQAESQTSGEFADQNYHHHPHEDHQNQESPLLGSVSNNHQSNSPDVHKAPRIDFTEFNLPSAEIGNSSHEGLQSDGQTLDVYDESLDTTSRNGLLDNPSSIQNPDTVISPGGPTGHDGKQTSAGRPEDCSVEPGRTALLHPAGQCLS